MASDVASAADTPISFKVGERTYLLSQMTTEDLGKLSRWAETQFFEDMKRRIAFLPEEFTEERQMIARRIVTIGRTELRLVASDYMMTVEAGLKEKHMMLLHLQPEMTYEEAMKLVGTQEFKTAYNQLEEAALPTSVKRLEKGFIGVIKKEVNEWEGAKTETAREEFAEHVLEVCFKFVGEHKKLSERPTEEAAAEA